MTDQYSKGELELAVRQEKSDLVREHTQLVKRLTQIEARLGELDTAENLLEGM